MSETTDHCELCGEIVGEDNLHPFSFEDGVHYLCSSCLELARELDEEYVVDDFDATGDTGFDQWDEDE